MLTMQRWLQIHMSIWLLLIVWPAQKAGVSSHAGFAFRNQICLSARLSFLGAQDDKIIAKWAAWDNGGLIAVVVFFAWRMPIRQKVAAGSCRSNWFAAAQPMRWWMGSATATPPQFRIRCELAEESKKQKKSQAREDFQQNRPSNFFTLFSRRGNAYLWKCLRVIGGRRRIRMVIISLTVCADDWLVRLEESKRMQHRRRAKCHRRLSRGKWMRAQSTDYKPRKKPNALSRMVNN